LDYDNEITDLGKRVTGLEHDVSNLCGWQKTQNGALLRVDGKVDNLQKWIMGVLAGVVASIFINLIK
jgi:hypothetical protein